MNSQNVTPLALTPFFDGHNDALLRLFMHEAADAPRAFIDGGRKGQLDLPMAVQGGFAGGMFSGAARSGTALASVETWVRANCATVPASAYGGSTTTTGTTTPTTTSTDTLYDCTHT